MKKLLYIILLFAIIISCSPSRAVFTYGTSMQTVFEKTITKMLFDSLCKADTITNNLNKWKQTSFFDGESGVKFILYYFIKKSGAIYRCLKEKDSIWISKRIVK